MSNLAAVVALLSLGAVTYMGSGRVLGKGGNEHTGHVTVSSTGVASLSSLSTTVSTSTSASVSALSSAETATVATSLWAVAGNVTDLGALIDVRIHRDYIDKQLYLVALLGSTTGLETTATTSSTLSSRVLAIAGDVARLTTLVAGLVLWSIRALTA